MTKVLFLIRKRADLTSDEFWRYWRETHAPIAARMPGLRTYVLNRAIVDPAQDAPTYDGIAELTFDSPEAFQAALASPEGQATLADVPRFLDADAIRVILADAVTTI